MDNMASVASPRMLLLSGVCGLPNMWSTHFRLLSEFAIVQRGVQRCECNDFFFALGSAVGVGENASFFL